MITMHQMCHLFIGAEFGAVLGHPLAVGAVVVVGISLLIFGLLRLFGLVE